MSWFCWTILLVLVGHSCGSGIKPAVRVRLTQKGLDYAISSAMEYAQARMENYPLPDAKGNFYTLNYGFTDMKIFNIDIRNKSLRPVARKGLYSILRNVDFDISGKWKVRMSFWFSNYGTFSVTVRGMSIGILINLGVNGGRLVVSNVSCASKLDNIHVDLQAGQATSFFFPVVQTTVNSFIKTMIPSIACKEAKKAIKKNLDEQFAKFQVKQHLKKSVTLDYSVVKKPKYTSNTVDLFLKGEFQPSNGNKAWAHQPAPLPRDESRDRMMYVTIMDHMINSAGQAYYNQDVLRVQVSVNQDPPKIPLLSKKGIGRYLSRVNAGLGVIKQSACSSCNLDISISATSPPQIKTNHSGIHLTIHAIAKINVVLSHSVKEDVLDVETNVTATAIPKLNGTNLSTKIENLNINTRVISESLLMASAERVDNMKKIVERQIEKLLENGISAMEIPLPLSEKFQLVKPAISYGEGYITLKTDISII